MLNDVMNSEEKLFSIEQDDTYNHIRSNRSGGMLILGRKVGESIIIDEHIIITILSVRGNQVRLGTNAPRDISVHREEIYRKIKRSN